MNDMQRRGLIQYPRYCHFLHMAGASMRLCISAEWVIQKTAGQEANTLTVLLAGKTSNKRAGNPVSVGI